MEVYFLDSESEIMNYSAEEHLDKVHKFLCLQLKSKDVLVTCSSSVSTHAKLLNIVMSQMNDVTGIFGAGAMRSGKILNWKSEGFQIKTPDLHKPRVKKALGVQ